MKKKPVYTDPYQLDGRIPIGEAIPLGLQHVLAMFVGNLSPLLIIMGTSSGFIGINNAITISILGGIAAGTITSDVNAGIFAYGVIMGASLIGGIFEMGLGFLIRPLRKFFPTVVTGTVVLSIGLSLIPVGVSFFCGGSNAPDFGHMWNLFLGLLPKEES